MPTVILTTGFAAGAILHLILIVLARPSGRRLDRLFVYLFGALFFWHAGNLLALTLGSFSGAHREVLIDFARGGAFAGLALLSPLLVSVHLEYFEWRGRRYAWLFYLPLLVGPWGVHRAAVARGIPRGIWTQRFIVYFCVALIISAVVNLRLAHRATGHLRLFHRVLAGIFIGLLVACVYAFLIAPSDPALEAAQYLLLLSSLIPSAIVGYWMFRFNFLEAGTQRSVAAAVLGLVGALVYALGIARLGILLERAGYLPSEVTEVVLLFCLIALAEPVFRRVRGWMAARASAEMARLESLKGELHDQAMRGMPEELRAFAERRIGDFLESQITVSERGELTCADAGAAGFRNAMSLHILKAYTHEAFERCRMAAEQTRLQRELSERQKMAALGEMVAFIAHRLKNPLSAINTLVQVIGERAPDVVEQCSVIRGEIRRLSTAVSDLLRFTVPGETGEGPNARTSAPQALREAIALFGPEATSREVKLKLQTNSEIVLPISPDRLHDLLTSLLGNALDAAPRGSEVILSCERASVAAGDACCPDGACCSHIVLAIEDEGPGIAPEHQERIFDPFFTLKPGGTGLGLALARRRADEAGARLVCISPARGGSGTRFELIFHVTT